MKNLYIPVVSDIKGFKKRNYYLVRVSFSWVSGGVVADPQFQIFSGAGASTSIQLPFERMTMKAIKSFMSIERGATVMQLSHKITIIGAAPIIDIIGMTYGGGVGGTFFNNIPPTTNYFSFAPFSKMEETLPYLFGQGGFQITQIQAMNSPYQSGSPSSYSFALNDVLRYQLDIRFNRED